MYLGDFETAKTVRFGWNTNAIAGESITRATNGTVSVYKDGGLTQSVVGVTDTEDFDGLTGVHFCAIDMSADGTFYSAGAEFMVVLSAATIDGKVINSVLAHFSIRNRSALMPTTEGRKLDVSAGGETGVDWANVGSPTTVVGLSGTTVKTATDVETDTADIQSRIPAALVSGRIAANAEVVGDKTGYALSAAGVQAIWDALTSALITVGSVGKLLVDNVNATISSRSSHAAADVWSVAARLLTAGTNIVLAKGVGVTGFNDLDAAGVRTAVGLAAANLDTQIDALPTAAEGADAVWDEARAGHVGAGSFGEGSASVQGNVTGSVGSVTAAVTVGTNNDKAGYALSAAGVQAIWDALTAALTTVGSIGKRIADNLDAAISSRLAAVSYTAPLDAAGTRAAVGLASANLDVQLNAIDDFIDTEVAAIKAKTDLIPASPAAVGDAMALTVSERNSVADALLDRTNGIETSYTPRQSLRLMFSVLAGKVSGMTTHAPVFRDVGDTKNRVTATTDADGNRSSVTLDGS